MGLPRLHLVVGWKGDRTPSSVYEGVSGSEALESFRKARKIKGLVAVEYFKFPQSVKRQWWGDFDARESEAQPRIIIPQLEELIASGMSKEAAQDEIQLLVMKRSYLKKNPDATDKELDAIKLPPKAEKPKVVRSKAKRGR